MNNLLPPDMDVEVKKLTAEYPIEYDYARWFYMMGGYEHAKVLLDYKFQLKLSDAWIKQINQGIWDKKNKELFKEFESLQ